jgi:hypothetical protein
VPDHGSDEGARAHGLAEGGRPSLRSGPVVTRAGPQLRFLARGRKDAAVVGAVRAFRLSRGLSTKQVLAVLIAVGAALALFVMVDAVRTTINLSDRPGPMARTVVAAARRVVRTLPDRLRGGAGLAMTVAVVVSWTLGLWLAWTVAMLDPAIEVVRAGDGSPLGTSGAFYFAGFSIFTLGTGDVEAATSAGRFVSVVASGTGLFTVTLEVTYLLSLTRAAAQERRTARQTFALGGDVATILTYAARDRSFRGMEPVLFDLAGEISELAEHHRTFPVLHDVLPRDRQHALGPSLLAMSDALDAMHFALPDERAVGVLAYRQCTEAIDGLLGSLPSQERWPEAPPRADPAVLLALAGCEAENAIPDDAALDERRRGLYALATEEGWRHVADEVVRVAHDEPSG